MDAGDVSWHHTAHDLVSIIAFLCLIFAPIVTGWRIRSLPAWRSLSWPSMSVTPVLLVMLVFFVGEFYSDWLGAVERVFITLAFAWLAVMGRRLYTLSAR